KYTEGEYIKITPASDGENGYVLITAPDYCGAVITGGGDYACTGLLTLMLGENERHLDFLRITDNSTNSLKMASDMYGDICDTVILDNDDKALAERTGLFSDCYIYETHTFEKSSSKIVFDTDSTAIVIGNNTVNISEITKAENDKINICYGYQKTEPQISSQLFLIDKKQKKLGDSCTALYYTEANITVKQDGIVINKNHV
ncbi:MAG: hypothetical protein IKT78_01925, partial [Ruminiclostridium sp.]|nr:hypothetical protein [Ruminiclostridium sp.]